MKSDRAFPPTARLHPSRDRRTAIWPNRLVCELRQSYLRVAKRAAIMVGRYTQAHQVKARRRQLSSAYLLLPHQPRQSAADRGNTSARYRFASSPTPLLASVYAIKTASSADSEGLFVHAPGECIVKGKGPCPLRVRLQGVYRQHQHTAPKGGHFVLQAKACMATP